MTGEITLRGRVLPIGGLREKLVAAYRAGIKTLVLPKKNEKDLVEVPKRVLRGLKLVPVERMEEVLQVALLPPPADRPSAPARRRASPRKGKEQPSVAVVQ